MSGLELRTERLVLRPVAAADLEDCAAMYADPEVVRFIGDGNVATTEGSTEWLDRTIHRNELDGWDMRTVRLRDGTFIGRCGIAIRSIEGRTEPELSYITLLYAREV